MANVAEANWQRLGSYTIPWVKIEQNPDQILITQQPPFWKQKASPRTKPARVIVGLAWMGGALVMLLNGSPGVALAWFLVGMFPAFLIMFIVYQMYPEELWVLVERGAITVDDNGKKTLIMVDNIKGLDVRRDQRGTAVYVWDGIVPVRAFVIWNDEEGTMLKEALASAIALLNQGVMGGPPAAGKKFEE